MGGTGCSYNMVLEGLWYRKLVLHRLQISEVGPLQHEPGERMKDLQNLFSVGGLKLRGLRVDSQAGVLQ